MKNRQPTRSTGCSISSAISLTRDSFHFCCLPLPSAAIRPPPVACLIFAILFFGGPAEAVPHKAPSSGLVAPVTTTWAEVFRRQAELRARPDRERQPSISPYISRMEYQYPDLIIAERKRIADFEAAVRRAIANGEEPPRFWQPYDPEVDQMDASAEEVPPAGSSAEVGPPEGSRSGPILAPSPYANWSGLSDTGRPSDSHLAVGPAHVGIMVNKELAFYTKDGTMVRGPVNYEAWWSSAPVPNDLFDPKIVYDSQNGHWIMLAINGRSGDPETYFAISVSQTSNPEGVWWTWYLRSDMDGGTDTALWADYPGLGFDSGDMTTSTTTGGAVYITSNQFDSSGSFQYAKLRVVAKHQLYTGGNVGWWDFWGYSHNLIPVFTWKPAVTMSSTGTSPTEYLINSLSAGTFGIANYVVKWRVTQPLSASGPTLSGGDTVSTNSYSVPPAAKQLDGGSTILIDSNDCRTQDLQYRGGYLYLAIGDASDFGSGDVEAVIHVFKINASSNNVVWDNRYGANNLYYSYPNIMADADGDVIIGFSRSGSTIYPEVRVTGRLSTDTQIQGSALVKAGEAMYNPTTDQVDRWGDYNGVGVDCAGDGKGGWVMSQYGVSSNTWATWVGGSSFGSPNVLHLNEGDSLWTSTAPRYFTWKIYSYDWAGTAIYNSLGGDNDLAVSDTCPFGVPYQSSTYGTDVRDFVVANGAQYGTVYHHSRVTHYGGASGYRIEARNQATDRSVGSTATDSLASSELMDLFEVTLVSGKSYAAVVDIQDGTADLDLWAFKGTRQSGRRGDNDGSSQTTGAGLDETLAFTASESSKWGFVVLNENFGSSNYTFRVWLAPIVAAIGDETIAGGLAYTGPTPSLTEGTPSVAWSLSTGPTGMTIDSATGVVSWTSPTAGTHTISIQADNPAGSDSESWLLTVLATPTPTPSDTPTTTSTPTVTETPTQTLTPTKSPSPSNTPTMTLTLTGTITPLATATETQLSPTQTGTATWTPMVPPSATKTSSPTPKEPQATATATSTPLIRSVDAPPSTGLLLLLLPLLALPLIFRRGPG